MPRPLRIEFENAWYHVMNRGANKQVIFKTDSHRNLFYTLLSEVSDRFKIEIHAFCLMSNHYHLLVKTPYANLGKAMRHLDGLYTQRFNRITNRDGALFRGRYKAILIESDQYLLQVSRYIHLNPVEAKLSDNPVDYKWSSYRAYINKTLSIAWLKTTFILNQMNGSNKLSVYESFVTDGIDSETKMFYSKKHTSTVYGTKKFIDRYLNKLDTSYSYDVLPDINHTKPLPKSDEILNSVMQYFSLAKNQLHESIQGKSNLAKMISIYLLSQVGHLTYERISEIFTSLKKYSISTQISRLKKQMASDKKIKRCIDDITHNIQHG